MHSAIEQQFRQKEIELPSDYIQCMKQARKASSQGGAYTVTEMTHESVLDFSSMCNAAFSSDPFKGIIQCHYILYEKGDGNADPTVGLANEIGGEIKMIRYRKRGGKHSLGNVGQCYDIPPGIKSEKKKDLLSMIDNMSNKTIARMYSEDIELNRLKTVFGCLGKIHWGKVGRTLH